MPAGMHGHGQGRGGRKKKSPAAQSPGPTPPYPVRDRPAERKKFNKTGKRNVRKQAEAEEFPWHRELDFMALKHVLPLHRWNTNEYDPNILDAMAAVRVQNGPIILKIDQELADKQKNSRNRKKGVSDTPNRGSTMGEDTGDNDSDEEDAGKGTLTKRKNENIGGDPYYSGNFSFVKEADRLKALEFGFKTPDDLLDAAEQVTDPHSRAALREACKKVMICWNPGKKGATEQLEQAVFRAYDTLITREQYDRTLILTKRAAECIVDFCPDLLWRETLLRMVAEAGYGNTDIRNRFCYNGCYADKATITKRIAAALGQKQVNQPRKKDMQAAEDSGEPGSSSKLGRRRGPEAKTKGERYLGGEKEWHDGNKKEFDDYVRFFGLRPGSGYLRKPKAGEKRRMSGGGGSGGAGGEEMEMEDTVGGASREDSSSGRDVKRARTEETAASPGTMSEEAAESGSPEVEDEEEDEQDEGGDDEDAVSEQSDGVLDEIED
ncbi:hypothetical protein B0A55_06137 [Friedmanniomyces simplex]|uniref:Uncharacterized protein n=1 Tax=Friedmanniomyces simplex TaxID=329884 RepID=A0A4U0XLS7_9PEZI|nr:hypothetical protein B0A55_06137 [Friedmanniomyces simplex]